MRTAAELRRQVESALAGRCPSALSPRPPAVPELISCAVPEIDTVLGGGLPLGAITEVAGEQSSGRTTLALSVLSEITGKGESCAYVDASDSLDPVSAAALGVRLRRLLWVRVPGTSRKDSLNAGARVAAGPLFAAGASAPVAKSKRVGTMGWCHPRNETTGLDHAVSTLFQSVPAETVDLTPRCSEAKRLAPLQPVEIVPVTAALEPQGLLLKFLGRRESTWERLDQALRATDLLLNTGGFRAIVLDLGDVAPAQTRRVPLATWYRFRLQAEKARTLFLLITRIPCANSCAALSLRCEQEGIDWQQAALGSPQLLAGLGYRIHVERNRASARFQKKPAAFAEACWQSTTSWSR